MTLSVHRSNCLQAETKSNSRLNLGYISLILLCIEENREISRLDRETRSETVSFTAKPRELEGLVELHEHYI